MVPAFLHLGFDSFAQIVPAMFAPVLQSPLPVKVVGEDFRERGFRLGNLFGRDSAYTFFLLIVLFCYVLFALRSLCGRNGCAIIEFSLLPAAVSTLLARL